MDAGFGQCIRGKVWSEWACHPRFGCFNLGRGAARRGAARRGRLRIWWNWQTRYFEVVVPQGVQVQVLLSAPVFLRKMGIRALLTEPGHKNRPNSTAEN